MKRLLAILMMLLTLGCITAAAEEAEEETTNYYTVTYLDAYFGQECPPTQAKMPGVDLTLSSDLLEHLPYIFCGWSEERLDDTADYMPGAIFTEDRDMTLYAVWQLAYDAGTLYTGDVCEIPAMPIKHADSFISFSVTQSGRYRLESNAGFFANSSLSHGGYILDSDGTVITTGELIGESWNERYLSIVADLTAGTSYYLQYINTGDPLELTVSEVTYTITYSANGRNCYNIPDPQYKHVGEAIQLSSKIPDTWAASLSYPFTGFIGWAESPDAVTPSYVPGYIFTEDRDLTLYAVWSPAKDMGTVDGSASWPIETCHVSGAEQYVKFSVSEDGWYRFRSIEGHQGISGFIYNASGTQLAIGESSWSGTCYDYTIIAELEADTEYYLQYRDEGYSFQIAVDHSGLYVVQYDLGDYPQYAYTNVPKTQAKTAGDDLTLTWRIPEINERYALLSFAGWATSPDATEPEYLPEDTYSADESATLYAVWDKPYGPILLTGPEEITIDTGVLDGSPAYIEIIVTESTRWTIETTGGYYTRCGGWNEGYIFSEEGSQIAAGTAVYGSTDSTSTRDSSITCTLSPYTSYYLNINATFYEGTHIPAIPLRITPQYTGDPYSAEASLPEGTETIEASAFASTALTSLLLPESVQSIGSLAFSDCDDLTRLVIENPEIVIAADAFSNDGLEYVNLLLVGPREGNVFDFCWKNKLPFRRLDN